MYGKQLVLSIVEVTAEGLTCSDGNMLFNPLAYKFITKHRDGNGNEFTCIHFLDGSHQFVSDHPLEIKKQIEGAKPTNADDFTTMREAIQIPKPVPLNPFPPEVTREFPDEEAPLFKTQIVKRQRGRPRKDD